MRNTIETMRRVRMAEAAASSFLVGDSIWAAPDLACVLPFEPAAPVLTSTGEAGEQIDRDALDAVELAHGTVHVRLTGGACQATHIEFILSHGFSFLWLGIGIVNLPILYTHTPWGCPVIVGMYDFSLQMRVAAQSVAVSAKHLNL